MNLSRALLPTSSILRSAPAPVPLTLRDRSGGPLRRRRDTRTQAGRRVVQLAFAALNVWIGIEFFRWVRHYETAGAAPFVPRPAGVEGWLPIAALMNLKYALLTWEAPPLHAAGMFLLVAFLAMSWLLRKAFCSWLCPIGTLSELLWEGGQAALGRSLRAPRWLDIPLRSLKYILLGLFLYAVGSMSVPAIRAFLESPYGLVADVKMLDFFRHMSRTVAMVRRRARRGVGVRPERMVPIPVSLRGAAGARGAGQPDPYPAHRRRLHRLREVRHGLPRRSAGRQAGQRAVCGMHDLPPVHHRLPVAGRPAVRDRRVGGRCPGGPSRRACWASSCWWSAWRGSPATGTRCSRTASSSTSSRTPIGSDTHRRRDSQAGVHPRPAVE